MDTPSDKRLTGRERQIMDIVYERGQASALEIQEALPGSPSYSTVRTLLRILEEKQHLTHRKQGAYFIYSPIQPRQQVAQAALAQVVKTFFENSVERVVTALLSTSDTRLSAEELERLSELIEQAKKEEVEE
ncbi:MAG TPA: BlaI/MecI/CopY family transcriptional regulator [Chthonomonadaceae bacterium]|nr:BlaI/MecI/CopY family transcriptional regulator [Chthonomonadaceae bacterium]